MFVQSETEYNFKSITNENLLIAKLKNNSHVSSVLTILGLIYETQFQLTLQKQVRLKSLKINTVIVIYIYSWLLNATKN